MTHYIFNIHAGIQQSPATGRAISELILDGKFQTIDLKRFGFDRLVDNVPMREVNIVWAEVLIIKS